MIPDSDALALYVAVEGLFAFVHVPAPPLHVPPVAPPPTEPPIAAEVPPWHIAANAPPAFAVGFAFTVIVLVVVAVPHEPPFVVSVKVIVPDSVPLAVYVAVAGLLALVHVPAPPLHVPPVAPPPTEPPIATDVAPWHIAGNTPPALAVGRGFTVIEMGLLVAVVGEAQSAFDVNIQVTISLFAKAKDV